MDTLAHQLPRPVKEVITEFPGIAAVLNEYDIGCGSCMVGTCLLKDIVSIHNLSPEAEKALMARLAAAFEPEAAAELPRTEPILPKNKPVHRFSPPMKRLVDEHLLIKKWLALIPEVIKNMDLTTPEGRKEVEGGIEFIRSYADKFHHAKEEEILFACFDGKAEVIQAMLGDHETGRRHVSAMREALDKRERTAVIDHLQAYSDLLSEHIKKEDEILFPWMDRELSEPQQNAIAGQFDKAEREMGTELPARCASFIAALEAIHPPA